MIGRDYGWVTLPSLLILAASWFGPDQIANGCIAVLLVWPVGLFSVWWVRRLMARHPRRVAVGWGAVSLLRMTVALGGGCAFFFGQDREPADGVALWVWIIVAYLSTLAAEVFVLAKPGWVGRGTVGGKG
ncbi:hypothetical protein PX52LOC_04022 [Limnoglobus roseus]|uniref:Uncharacterized protein n=1 Tax=Limnoglobus roseus TaxID=2598579 RepID=A0A5C1AGD2_9BACT|nr:hypothetical protein PX52LOC_04022 [Limnoglobus roseus]